MNKSEIISICKKSDTLTKNQYLALYQIILHGDSFEKSEIADLLIDHVNKKSMYLLSVLWKDKDSLVRMCAYDTVSVYPAKFTTAAVTTIEEVNSTGNLIAVQDGPSHVSIKPRNGTMSDWIKAGTNSIWTKTLKRIVKRYPR